MRFFVLASTRRRQGVVSRVQPGRPREFTGRVVAIDRPWWFTWRLRGHGDGDGDGDIFFWDTLGARWRDREAVLWNLGSFSWSANRRPSSTVASGVGGATGRRRMADRRSERVRRKSQLHPLRCRYPPTSVGVDKHNNSSHTPMS